MNVLVIEPPLFMFEKFEKEAGRHDDKLYYVIKKTSKSKDENILNLDIRDDFDVVVKYCEQLNIDVIICISEEYLLQASYLSECTGIFSVLTSDLVKNMRDKFLMKKIWTKANILNASSIEYSESSIEEVQSLNYPVIVKPNLGFSSSGVRLVHNLNELNSEILNIKMLNTLSTAISSEKIQPKILVEEFLCGDEYSADVIWQDGIPQFSKILKKWIPQGSRFPDKLYHTIGEDEIDIETKILQVVYQANRVLGMNNGATHTEVIVTKDDEIYVIETAARIGAGGIFSFIFEEKYGVEYLGLFYAIATNRRVDIKESMMLHEVDETLYYFSFDYPDYIDGTICDIKGIDFLYEDKNIFERVFFKNKNDYITTFASAEEYFLWILGKWPKNSSINALVERLVNLEKNIEIIVE
ncbi:MULTISPECIES: ATP-grasp domain-containing protein [Bacillus cereus group]|uniref:ATP-grasp domain-containing protein n=3 Tax=Bacillus cytotoxicus TaxID=580165 RepID=A0AAX2CBJ5_9BACI|nr:MULTISPECIES: ATP-grasp domain-containing protein [Bacillus cereus group]AWC39292.1 ATP-grasp domain-containing protein [Bacillus cytotoxicus]AWC47223.1 ATP-grasp domain-containing protein [Bacillus cytotoxicus]AWC51244.1 ATP-grasp domain-containing protein [Bacillus cytotoxicus]AWC55373.1 ATP-grasp domain-containing protein [Bacillus cytotoxicus]AWC63496.1 ATP-grasp domain-containing protein [Bacillus cytotoxicus]